MADTPGTNTTYWDIPGTTSYRTGYVLDIASKKLRIEAANKSVFSQFMGKKGDMSPIIVQNEFKTINGDTVNVQLLANLTGAGKAGSEELEGSEEAQKYHKQAVYINLLRHAVKDEGEMSEQRTPQDTIENGRKNLGTWWKNRFDLDMFNTIYYGYPDHIAGATASGGYAVNSSAAVPPRYWDVADEANNAATYSATPATHVTNIQTAEGTLSNVDTDFFSPALVEGEATKLEEGNAEKIEVGGFVGYLCIAHPRQIHQLRLNEKWFAAMKDAMPRDEKGNPLFRGVNGASILGMWDGVIIMSSNFVQSGAPTRNYSAGVITSGNTNGAYVRRAVFMGAGAVAVAVKDANPRLIPKNDFDYYLKRGVAISGIWGSARADYKSFDGNDTIISQNLRVVSTYSPATTI
jgi:N4-gp56 family major capsid protein